MPRTEIIYDGILDPSIINQSVFFRDATMLFMEAPDLPAPLDLELDISLQIYLKPGLQQHVDLNVFAPNQFGSFSIVPIPLEYWGSGFNQQLILLSALQTRCIVTAVFPDYQAQKDVQTIDQKIDFLDNWMRTIEQKLDLILVKI